MNRAICYSIVMVALIFSFTSNAQSGDPVEVISEGTRFIGGNISMNFSNRSSGYGNNISEYNSSSFSIGPTYGKYFNDNLAWGTTISNHFDQTNYLTTYSKSNAYGIGITVFLVKNYKVVNNLFFELQPRLSFGYSWQKTETEFAENNSRGGGSGLGISPGLLFFISNRIGLRLSLGSLGYNYSRSTESGTDYKSSNHSFGLNGGLSSVGLSLRYFLR